jgi:hypothetical protein
VTPAECIPCAFDAGFDNIEPLIGYDNNVLNKYLNEYLPRAVSVLLLLVLPHCILSLTRLPTPLT